ncbi:VWA domain-containing protein [Dethiosulfatarculus sandiegensis]|uniref:VWFA domain-containing protein n=1 Tax=Dethiosulfatarculus sandiegensis TaxID=1429043 RepID=A0A0D2HVH6_9BACT|nr:VWA domain-containing protein [Dethiosulfatarculus sandiegensis]KIX14403.1 hypothetical protein X474_09610 [Dethiosulfatarculus sandiegensis]
MQKAPLIKVWRFLLALPVFIFLLIISTQAWSMNPSDMRIQHTQDVQKAKALVEEFDKLVKQGAGSQELSRQALRISTDYQAKLLLKNEGKFKDLGHLYHDLMKGPQGNSGVLSEVLEETRRRLRALNKYPPSVIDDITLIQNQASVAQKKPPMDVDAGLKVNPNTPEGKVLGKKYMKELGGPGGVASYHDDLKKAMEEAYEHVAEKKYKVKVDSGKAFLEGTTPWHVEAYLDSEVLKEGGLPQKSLIEQTVSVSTHKNNHFLKEAMEGKISWGSAYQEAARGTLKDMDKVDRVFEEIRRQTGKNVPRLSKQQEELRKLLKKMTSPGADPISVAEEIKKLTRGKNVFNACNGLVETMESAIKFSPPAKILKARFYRHFLATDDLKKALQALIDDKYKDLPKAAQALDRRLAKIAGLHMVSLEKMSTKQFLEQLKKSIGDLKFDTVDELMDEIFKRIHTSSQTDMAMLFGEKSAKELEKVAKLTDPAVKNKIAARYRGKFLLWQIDEKTQRVLLGDGGIKSLAFDGIIGVATAMHQTSSIMDDTSLSEEDKNLRIANAWVTALPMVGDFASSIINGIDAYYEGDKGKAVQSGVFLVIGVAYAVPGFQVPAVVAGLGMVAWQLGGSAWDISKDKAIIWAWVDSGKWEGTQGKMLGLMDSKGKVRPVAPPEKAFESLMEEGEIGYHTGLSGMTIKKSIYEFMDRTIMASNQNVKAMRTAIQNLYPDFVVDDYLHEHINLGRTALAKIIREKGGNVRKDVALALYVKLKKDIYDKAALEAIKKLKSEAEAEYQAKYMVGDAAQAFRDLEAIAQKLRLPLVKHVWEIYESFVKWATEKIKSPWTRHSLPRRHVELAKKYVHGYTLIDESLDTIRETIKKAGLKPPEKFHLTGWLEIDRKRVDGLVNAYRNALVEAKKDVEQTHAQAAGLTAYKFDPKNPCDQALFLKLARLKVIMVHSRDMMLLMEEWAGKSSAADKSRDEALQNALDQVDNAPQPLWSLPLQTWSALSSTFEEAYSWAHVTWEGSQVLLTARDTIEKRIEQKKKEYEEAKAQGLKDMIKCLANITVHLRYKNEDGEEKPILKGKVLLKGAGPIISLDEMEDGDYTTGIPKAGDYTLNASAKGFKAQDGSDVAVVNLNIPEPPPGRAAEPIEKTIYLTPGSKPELKLEFKKATSGEPARLICVVTSPEQPLDPATFKLSLEGKDIKAELTPGAENKEIKAEVKFTEPTKPGEREVKITVTDAIKVEHILTGKFDYELALELKGHVLDDKGGSPENGKANSGEKVKIALKLINYEAWPLKDLMLTAPTDDERLKPTGEKSWKQGLLESGKEKTTSSLEFKAGDVGARTEAVTLPLSVTLAGEALKKPLDLTVEVSPSLMLEVTLDSKVDDPKAQDSPNNGDNKPNPGESVKLKLKVTNRSDQDKGPEYDLALSCDSSYLTLGQDKLSGTVLAPGASEEFSLPATVGSGFKKEVTVFIKAEVIPKGQSRGKIFKLPLLLELAALEFELKGVTVEDPKSGSLLNRNNGNNKLGTGEYGYLTFTVVNKGPKVEEVYFNLTGPRHPGLTIIKPQSQAGGSPMPTDQPVQVRFEVDVPPDYLDSVMPLTIKAHDAATGRKWQAVHKLPVEVKSDFVSSLVLLGAGDTPAKPEEIAPGAKLGFKLKITNKTTQPQQGLGVGLRYTQVSVIPNLWTGQNLAAGADWQEKGAVSIPKDFNGESFDIALDVTNAAGTATLHKNKFTFKLGKLPTKIKLTPKPPAQGQGDWGLMIEVTTKAGTSVEAGGVTLTAGGGALSQEKLSLTDGKAQVSWSPPANLQGQVEIKVSYTGDESDPALPDKRYEPSQATIKLPALTKATKVLVKASKPASSGGKEFAITIQVIEEDGKPVSKGGMTVTSNLGTLSGGGIGAKGGTVKWSAPGLTLQWKAPVDRNAKGKAVFQYLGDVEDPALPDKEYSPSKAELDLPPQVLMTPDLTVQPVLIDQQKGLWRLDVSLTGEGGRPISPSELEFKATGGSFGDTPGVLTAKVPTQGGQYGKGWVEEPNKQHTITVNYAGDQSGPGKTNQKYDPVSKSVTLPPNLIARSTVFVVDASGSMRGSKLTSAKAAVRAALSSYAPGQADEEWALIVFFSCGSIQLRQPFTTNPADITSRLDFGASGGTPIARSMSKAAGYLRSSGRGQTGRIILLSDGGESCRGKPVEAAKSIFRRVRQVTPAGGGRP